MKLAASSVICSSPDGDDFVKRKTFNHGGHRGKLELSAITSVPAHRDKTFQEKSCICGKFP
jgi:hypothetical protein